MSAAVVLATRNRKKLDELQRILEAAGLDIELLSIDAFPDAPEVAETESTFAGNALLKARAIAQSTGLPAVADDSGLCVDALNGMPGVLSARWAGGHGDDEANLDLVLAQIEDVPDRRRTASFRCAAAIALPDGTERVVEGSVDGELLRERRGVNGFGYDPIFVPLGHDVTTAQMSAEDKDAISHRGQAMRALAPVLAELLGT
ncbi:MAG TPA: non-canonical purine NTP pyrophosphatase, RdgB/HAM1 family [Actinobacteria bacterium]|jgi:XTP/dITP diphosphohydrolase|nr:non-canonical purine NTP pyrophosphatase, RdgB/HAM1 family [Actinomycetota bacterium]